jgi:type VI secretion system protein ImpA
MSAIDIEKLLAEVSADSPCGEDLSYDPAYIELETIAQGKPEHVMGDQVIAGEEPNWRQVKDRCIELFGRTRDLRVTLYLMASLLKLESLTGLRDGLTLLKGMLDQHWDKLHPQLDPDDNNDPTERVNIVDALAKPPHTPGDSMAFQQRVREAELCESKQLGRFSLRDIAVARGDTPPPAGTEGSSPTTSAIDAAFMDTALEDLEAKAQAASESVDLVKQIEADLTTRLGAGNAPNLSSFVTVLDEVNKSLSQYLSRRGVDAPAGEAGQEGDQSEAAAGGGGAPAQAIAGDIRSRQDVMRMLDKICDYYLQHEPSSPVPILLKRAKRLTAKNFLEIIRDLTPEALKQIEVIQGVDSEAES